MATTVAVAATALAVAGLPTALAMARDLVAAKRGAERAVGVAKALAVAKMLLGVCANDKGSVVHGRSARAQVAAA